MMTRCSAADFLGWVRRIFTLSLLERIELPKVAQELKKAQVARQGRFADAAKHPQVGFEQREQTLGP
jgi:hypothetical protein